MTMIPGSPGKTFGRTSDTFGGGVTVWDGIMPIVRYPYGATFTDTLADGAVVLSGTPVSFNRTAKTVTICRTFRVHETVVSGNDVKITKTGSLPRLTTADVLMVAPATKTGTGQSRAITSIDTTNADYDLVTLTTGSLGTPAAGTVLVIASSVSATAAQLVTPTDFILNNIYVGTGDTNATSGVPVITDVVFAGSAMENRMPPFPAYMKLPEISGQRYMFNPE